jgi:hypothetical protein
MASVTRSVKDNGTTSWAANDTLNASDLNGDIDPIVTRINTGMEADNIANNAVESAKIQNGAVTNAKIETPAIASRADGIATVKISTTDAAWSGGASVGSRSSGNWTTGLESDAITSHSNTASAYTATTDPGVTGTATYPETLSQELERLRYMLKRLGIGVNAKLEGGTTAGWYDGNVTGPNLISNPSFLDNLSSGTNAPQGWTAVHGSGTSLSFDGTVALDVSEGAGKALRLTSSHANDNMTQTLTKLRASTKYLIEARVKPNAGDTVKLITTGAATGEFDDLDLVSSSSSVWQTLSGIIETDSTPTNIVVKIDPVASGDIAELAYVACKEISLSDRLGRNDGSGIAIRSTSTSAIVSTVQAALTASVVVPCPNCRVQITVQVGARSLTSTNGLLAMTLYEDIDGGGATDVAVSTHQSYNDDTRGPIHIDYVNSSPTVGGVHTYTIVLGAVNNAETELGDFHWMQVEVITP